MQTTHCRSNLRYCTPCGFEDVPENATELTPGRNLRAHHTDVWLEERHDIIVFHNKYLRMSFTNQVLLSTHLRWSETTAAVATVRTWSSRTVHTILARCVCPRQEHES